MKLAVRLLRNYNLPEGCSALVPWFSVMHIFSVIQHVLKKDSTVF